jgi:hypothetical protein
LVQKQVSEAPFKSVLQSTVLSGGCHPENRSEFKQELSAKERRTHEIISCSSVVRSKLGENPELAEAILKLEMALNVPAVKTAGMLWRVGNAVPCGGAQIIFASALV